MQHAIIMCSSLFAAAYSPRKRPPWAERRTTRRAQCFAVRPFPPRKKGRLLVVVLSGCGGYSLPSFVVVVRCRIPLRESARLWRSAEPRAVRSVSPSALFPPRKKDAFLVVSFKRLRWIFAAKLCRRCSLPHTSPRKRPPLAERRTTRRAQCFAVRPLPATKKGRLFGRQF